MGCTASLAGAFLANIDRKRKGLALLRLLGFRRAGVGAFVMIQAALLTCLRMFSICPSQPPLFMRKASMRRSGGIWSKPDSTTVSSVPPSASFNSNTTSVGGSAE
ncbi:hypothetical protein D3C86_1840340 [compost metagenome]